MIEISWINRFFKAGWHLTTAGAEREYLFSKRSLKSVPRNLRQGKPAQLRESLSKLSPDQGFTKWWDQTCAGKEDKLLRLLFPRESYISSLFTSSAWDVPWELLVERLKETEVHSTISLVRTLDINAPVAPSAFDEPMRILILQGDDGRAINRPLNLDAEAGQIKQAWNSIDIGARQCIDEPQVLRATQADLAKGLDKHKPHIIWFSGHGRVRPNSSLLFADGQWVTARDFAGLIKQSCQPPFAAPPPLYAVFWACDTGRAEERPETIPVSPALFEELSNVGVLSILAMQSPIRDVSALSMAQGLFGFLAAGYPLERAVARVRGRLIDDLPNGGYELDWATPVVWSAGSPVEHLTWNSPPTQSLAQLQLLGRETLRWRRNKPSELDGQPSPDELSRARTWASLSKVWIKGRYEDGENQNRWVRALQTIQVEAKRFVVAVDLRSGDTAEALQEWAENIHSRMLPGDFPAEVAKILSQMKRSPTSGWERLCELPDIYLAVAQPPAYLAPDWFWNPLLSSDNNLRVAIFSDQQISEDIEKVWSLDRVGSEMDVQSIEAAISTAPRLARALAVLNMPLGLSRISLQDEGGEGAQSLLHWQERDSVMIDTYAGPIMSATAREYILSNQDAELLKQAHNDCADMLNQREIRQTTEILEALLTHLLGAGQHKWALAQADSLCFLYREHDRPAAVLRLLGQLGPLWVDLPASALLRGAWAYLQLGKLDYAQLFLDRAEPPSSLDKTWKHGLQAELYKSQGDIFSKEDALAEIDAAIEECRNAQPDLNNPVALIQRRLRAYRQDRARILQFLFYKKEEAAKEYEELIREWSDQPEAVIDLAVVKRNYAECLRSLADGGDDPKRQRAQDILQEAEQLVKDHPYAPILSEILYEKARAAESASKLSEAHELLLACLKAANQSQHYMVSAIAENRLFWKYNKIFSLTRWAEVEADLAVFPKHGWAVRTLVDGRLRAARVLEALKDFEGAFKQLEGARRELERNPLFDMGGDKFRIAATRAGLQVVGQKIGREDSGWSVFTSSYLWASEWLRGRPAKSPEAIWSEVK
jgi:ElaB/YqjD/DUF883 family membrane-anchored ribosome-binding protein